MRYRTWFMAMGWLSLLCVAVLPTSASAKILYFHDRLPRRTLNSQVTVDPTSSLGVIPPTAFGINTVAWDADLTDRAVPSLLQNAGIDMLRFPGGPIADIYHWKTDSITPGQTGYVNPKDTFDAFMQLVQASHASAMITVNYGSNASGTGGGSPAEAAAWVKYANVTHQYGVKYWEIGNEVYGNGSYGTTWETDLHRKKGPRAYAKNAAQFIRQMKAVDPSIKVGVVLTTPGIWPSGRTPAWNRIVLTQLGNLIDFVDIHWYPQTPGSESDARLLSSTTAIARMVSTLHSQIARYCPTRASKIKIMVTETNSVAFSPGKQSVSRVNALFLVNDYMGWLEQGISNVDWWDLHNGISTNNNTSQSLFGHLTYGDFGVLSNGSTGGDAKQGPLREPPPETPFPTYYALEMLHHFASPGDRMLEVFTDQPQLSAYAVRHADGTFSVLLLNDTRSKPLQVHLRGLSFHDGQELTATVYGAGNSQGPSSFQIDASTLDAGQLLIQPYSMLILTT